MANRSHQSVDVAQRPDLLDLLGGQEVDVHSDGAGHPRVLAVLVHPVAVHREADVADEPQAHVLPGLLLQGAVQLHRVLVDLADGVAHVEQGQQPRRVPGRPGGQLPALHQHHVGPTLLRQVVEGADSDDATADDYDASLSLHGITGTSLLPGRHDRTATRRLARTPVTNRTPVTGEGTERPVLGFAVGPGRSGRIRSAGRARAR